MRGLDVYQTVWLPIIGEENLKYRHEEKNEEDEFAIGVYHGTIIRAGITCKIIPL